MSKTIKIGFMHLPGINDEAWKEHIANTAQGILGDVTKDYQDSNIVFIAPDWVSKEVAIEIQCQLGYNPLGYSFHSYSKIQTSGGYRSTIWKCWRSCD